MHKSSIDPPFPYETSFLAGDLKKCFKQGKQEVINTMETKKGGQGKGEWSAGRRGGNLK